MGAAEQRNKSQAMAEYMRRCQGGKKSSGGGKGALGDGKIPSLRSVVDKALSFKTPDSVALARMVDRDVAAGTGSGAVTR